MSDGPAKFTPTLRSNQGLKLQIPNTPEGREFYEKLKELLGGKELPFVQSCPTPINGAEIASGTGSTTYALDIRLEQEGWPP